jgi:hypothetical protein
MALVDDLDARHHGMASAGGADGAARARQARWQALFRFRFQKR